MKKTVGVVGAGLSGLVAIKELVEAGHDVICFEKNQDIGGVFCELGSYDSVELTVSNFFMSYSDFMPYDEPVKFWTRKEYKDYLDSYAAHFDILKHIRFNTHITNIEDNGDSFTIFGTNEKSEQITHTVEILSVCSGQFQKPNIPDIKGLETFTGKTLHSTEYTNTDDCQDLKGKKVLCLGAGESGADVVTEISEIAEHTVLSLRRNHVFSTKHVGPTNTIDMVQTRYWHSIPANKKASKIRKIWQTIKDNTNDQSRAILAEHILGAADEPGSVVTKTERVFEAAANGMRIDVGGIKEINGNEVEFASGKKESFDAIVFCTGFKFSLPFMDSTCHFSDIRDCYLQAFHKDYRERIAFIGFARPQQGGVPLIAELQARYFALVLSGKLNLPLDIDTLAQIDKKTWQDEFYETPHVFGLVNGQRFNEKLADLIGCRLPQPSILASPKASMVFWFHHVWPCQFRVVGPGANKLAQEKWLDSPSIHSTPAKIKLALDLFYRWVKTRNLKDLKAKWRPMLSS